MVVRGEAVPAGTETEINTAATTEIAANTSAMAPPEKEGGGWLNTFWSFVTGSRLVALVLGILVLAVILLITVIVLLFRGGVKKARKQEEEKQEDQERDVYKRQLLWQAAITLWTGIIILTAPGRLMTR